MDKPFLIGIDLHGTLLNPEWKIADELENKLISAINGVKDFCRVVVCSGNDLSFINQYLSPKIRDCFDGYILETGCVFSDGHSETVIVPTEMLEEIRQLTAALEKENIVGVQYFARRLATISLFTKHETNGFDPAEIHSTVIEAVQKTSRDHLVNVTHSDVAVDIIPNGYDKFTGLQYITNGAKTIGVADSLNDLAMIINADHAFVPKNASLKLIKNLENEGQEVININKSGLSIKQSDYENTEGVIQILEYINSHLRR